MEASGSNRKREEADGHLRACVTGGRSLCGGAGDNNAIAAWRGVWARALAMSTKAKRISWPATFHQTRHAATKRKLYGRKRMIGGSLRMMLRSTEGNPSDAASSGLKTNCHAGERRARLCRRWQDNFSRVA